MRVRFLVLAAMLGLIVALPSTAHAGHHLWKFSQLYSNAGGNVQYMMLEVNEDNEQNVQAFTITSGANVFTFPSNLTSSQTSVHKWILLGTSNIQAITGVMPDYTIPPNFFATGGGTLNYAGVDIWTYGAVPVEGKNSLHKSGATVTTGPNMAINFNLQSGAAALGGVPALPRIWIAVLVGAVLLVASGLLRRRALSGLADR